MNKNDLISKVADTSGLSKTDASNAVDAVVESIIGAMKSGDDVRLVGFGTFSVADRKASEGRNPRTGEKLVYQRQGNQNSKLVKVLKTL